MGYRPRVIRKDLIKTDKTFWLFHQPRMRMNNGWSYPVYFDEESKMYVVFDIQQLNHVTLEFEAEYVEHGLEFEFKTEEVAQYSSDHFSNRHEAKFF